jgi:hypothetical protein
MLTTLRADHGFRHGLNILSMFDMQSFPIRDAPKPCRVVSDWSYNRLTPAPIVGPDRWPTMAFHVSIEETIMANNQDYKGKGKGNQQNSDLASGPGDNAQRGDWGSQQSGNLDQGNQSQSDLGSGPGDNSQQRNQGRNRQSGMPNQNQQSDSSRGNMQSGGQGSRSGRNQLDQDDLDSDESM